MKQYLLTSIAIAFLLAVSTYSQNYTPHQYQQNDWFLDYGENTAQYVNPAGIAENDQIEISLGIFSTLSGNAGQEFLAVVHPFDYNHSAGFTFFENGSAVDGTTQGYIENAYQFGYAYRLGPRLPASHQLAIGANLTVLQFSLFEIKQFLSYGIDVGLTYNPISNSRIGHLQFGLAIQNLIQPTVEHTQTGNYKVPMNLNPSFFWRGLNRRIELYGSYSLVNIDLFGYEDSKIRHMPSGGATYFLSPLLGLKLKWNKMEYPVVGATVNVKRVNVFRYLQLDIDMSHDKLSSEDKERGVAFNLKAVTRVGPTREERIGAARYRRLKLEPEDAYREAMRLYLARKFLLASYAFGKVITKYPAFHLVDMAAYYKGKSFENLRMHTAARQVYSDALKKYEMSEVKPRYVFQLMNIDYKEGKVIDAAKQYLLISNLYKETDVKPDADYVMGQVRFMEKDYGGAINLLKPILPGNGNYLYARYTLAMSYFKVKKKKEAEACLKDIMESNPANISEQELQDVSAVKLGHLAFDAETARLVEAAKYYASVPPTSSKYDEALLGLAWSFIRAQRWKEAAQAAQELIDGISSSLLSGEAYLLRGYCYYFEKDYIKALSSFDKAVEVSQKQSLNKAEISKKEFENQQLQRDFEKVQLQAFGLAKQLPSARVLQKRDELRPQFDEIHEKIEDYIQYQHQVSKIERFIKNRDKVIKDAKFTKATVSSIMQQQNEQRGPSQQDLNELELE